MTDEIPRPQGWRNHALLMRQNRETAEAVVALHMPHVPKSYNNDRLLAMAAGLPGSPFSKDAAGRLRRNGRFTSVR